jgi:hypothetical protein
MTTVGDHFPEEAARIREEQARAREEERALASASAAEFLRAKGWEQSHFPGRHRLAEARVWLHPDRRGESFTFEAALVLASYPHRRRK